MTGIGEDIAIWTINDPSGLQGLNIEVSNNHPNIYKFIIDLKSEELLTHAKRYKSKRRHISYKKKQFS